MKMPKRIKNDAVGVSAAAKIKERNMLKKQRIAVIFCTVVLCLLIIALCVVLCLADIYPFEDINGDKYTVKKLDGEYALFHQNGDVCDITDFQNQKCYLTRLGTVVFVDAETGKTEIKIVVDTEGSEINDFGTTVMMFKGMTYDKNSVKDPSMIISSIEVVNQSGGYSFVRDESGNIVLSGNEDTPFSAQSFAMLANICGRTRASRRLENPVRLSSGEIDYSEYGLESETRKKTVTGDDGNEIEVEYEYNPTKYIITAMNGDRHEVTVGDLAVTETGYYAKYEGGTVYNGGNAETSPARDTIYVLTVVEDTIYGGKNGYELLTGRVENFVTPIIVYPMELNNYFNVSNFVFRNGIDYERIYSELFEKFSEEQIGSKEFLEEYGKLFEKYSHKVCDFSFYDMDSRAGSMNAYVPYISNLEYAAGYYLNGDNVDLMLSGFYSTEFGEVVKLSPTDEELEEYGLAEAPYFVSFLFKTEDEEGEDIYIENFVEISEKNESGYYYAYSTVYDMIVTVKSSSFDFIEWDETSWYSENYIQLSISHVDSILIESPAFSTKFEIEDSVSKYLGLVANSSKKVTVGDKEYIVEKDESGKYVLKTNGEAVRPIYSGDYLVTPVKYTLGERREKNYLFAESSETDIDGDGENDGIIYYFYDIASKDGKLFLVAQVLVADYEGNQLSDSKIVWGEVAYESQYFMSDVGYLFFTSKSSSIGMNIDKMFGNLGRGEWGKGRMFITSKGQNVIINSETGEWMIVDDVMCGLYLADSESSRLAQRAVTAPALYDENGKLTRYSDTYYPLTDKKLKYDDELDTIVAYDKVKKEWKKITYSDCTIGVWGKCEYYVLEGGVKLLVDSATGDIGEVAVLSSPTYVADIYADDKLLDYVISKQGYSESSKTATAMQNFQELYKYLLSASFEGLADLDEAQKREFMSMDDFTSGENEACTLKITLKASDFLGNEREVVYRFYRYSERRAYITVETLDGSESSSENAYGNFDVLYSFVRKVIEDAEKVVNGEPVYSSEKY